MSFKNKQFLNLTILNNQFKIIAKIKEINLSDNINKIEGILRGDI